MNASLHPHCGLTEPSRETMSGKGREGNKEGKGSRVVTFHHIVSYVTRTAETGW